MPASKKRLQWSKFNFNDWRSDTALRICSLGARGLWIEMLAIMDQANPRGFLLVNSTVPTNAQLGSLAGAPPEQITEYLGELESAGVFSRDGKERIYSRRMVLDEKKAKLARKNGKTGGNPTLCNIGNNSPPDNPPDNHGDILEIRDKSSELRTKIHAPPDGGAAVRKAFDELFWPSYPRRQQASGGLTRGNKNKAFAKFKALNKAEMKAALDGLSEYKKHHPDRSNYVPDAVRYLSEKKWTEVEDAMQNNGEERSGVMKFVPKREPSGDLLS